MLDHTRPTTNTPDAPAACSTEPANLPINRVYSLRSVEYAYRDVVVDFSTGAKLSCRIPVEWSDNAAAVLMSKYAVKAGVPDALGGVGGREVDAERIFARLVAGWQAAAIEHGYWSENSQDLLAWCDELKAMLALQIAAPNSPQWFNTGVAVQYGITVGDDGHFFAEHDPATGSCTTYKCSDSLERPQISACFIQSVDDNLVGEGGIMDLWTREARLFKYGSGSGSNFSKLRGKGEPLARGGASSGLISFLRVGDRSAGAIKSGGTTRRSARLVGVDVDHPDIEEFIAWKAKEDAKIRALQAAGIGDVRSFEDEATETVSGQNANNSVAVSDEFMRAVEQDLDWNLTRRTDGEVSKTLRARDLWRQIAQASWTCADPGLQFSSTINSWHTCPNDGQITGSNPCSEYVFLDDTACNLASLNLAKFQSNTCFDWGAYEHAARLWSIVLDVSVSMAGYPTAEIAKRSILYRTLGLGYAALGELLVMRKLGYGTQEGRDYAARLTSTLTRIAYSTSVDLAEKLGTYPRYTENRGTALDVLDKHATHAPGLDEQNAWKAVIKRAEKFGLRNAQVSLLAPTGTIGIVMDCETTGCEPFYGDTTIKKLAGGGVLPFASKRFAEALVSSGFDPEACTSRVYTVEGGEVCKYTWVDVPAPLKDVLVCASDLSPQQHIDMMAATQPFLSGAISKTVNLPSETTAEEIETLHMYAWKQGLKSIALYRDGCKPAQPLQSRKPPEDVQTFDTRAEAEAFAALLPAEVSAAAPTLERGSRKNPPDETAARKVRVELSGHTFYLIMSEHADGKLAEVFVTSSRSGSSTSGWVNAWAKMFSLALQHGTSLDVLVAAMQGTQFEPGGFLRGRPVPSPIAAFARIIGERYLSGAQAAERTPPPMISLVPAGAADTPRAKPTGATCSECGGSDLRPSGSCFICSCGATTGCS